MLSTSCARQHKAAAATGNGTERRTDFRCLLPARCARRAHSGAAVQNDELPIQSRGAIGDRRTGALASADGTIDWLCVPRFDGEPVFSALLDPAAGGLARLGPPGCRGVQRYAGDTAILRTTWALPQATIELSDTMDVSATEGHVLVRRLRHLGGASAVPIELFVRGSGPLSNRAPLVCRPLEGGAVFTRGDGELTVWASFASERRGDALQARHSLGAGGVLWVVLAWESRDGGWSVERAAAALQRTEAYWTNWSSELAIDASDPRASQLRRSAITVQLLTSAEHDAPVAALSTSLPERIGGDRNYDYRYAWIRDSSLALALLTRLGKCAEVSCCLDWLCQRRSETEAPLQVCYRIDGSTELPESEISDIPGHRGSLPIRIGNRAAHQKQLGSFGFLLDCASSYFELGGDWTPEASELTERVAEYVAAHWQEPCNGIWELEREADYVSSRVMSWVVLEKAAWIARQTGRGSPAARWQAVAREIHAEVMARGFCERKNAFRQRYDSDALDASALLIPLHDFLPHDHPRVVGTLAALHRELVVGGLLHRFDPQETVGPESLPLGRFEGAFLPCVFWHVQVLARCGRWSDADALLRRCESAAGDVGLFAEELDAHTDQLLGNTPLLFSQVEYVRAVWAVSQARAKSGGAR